VAILRRSTLLRPWADIAECICHLFCISTWRSALVVRCREDCGSRLRSEHRGHERGYRKLLSGGSVLVRRNMTSVPPHWISGRPITGHLQRAVTLVLSTRDHLPQMQVRYLYHKSSNRRKISSLHENVFSPAGNSCLVPAEFCKFRVCPEPVLHTSQRSSPLTPRSQSLRYRSLHISFSSAQLFSS
jgi:hypothetical protein